MFGKSYSLLLRKRGTSLCIKVIVVIFLLVISLSSSSCFYYKSMPKDWKSQTSNAENVAMFNGSYKLSDDNESLSDEYEYNDLRYFQNTVIYGLQLVYIPGLTSVNICATNNEVHVSLFSGKDMVHDSYFKKGSFDFKNGILTLDLKNQFVGGGLWAWKKANNGRRPQGFSV